MPITPGRYTITSAPHSYVVSLPDNKDYSSLVAGLKEDVPGEEWNVRDHGNGRYLIVNFGHKMSAHVEFRPQRGDHVVGREKGSLWLIEEHESTGNYTIATADNKLRWYLNGSWPDTPITLHNAPPSGPQYLWNFQKIDHVDTTPHEVANKEVAAARAELAKTLAELEVARQEAAATNAMAAEDAVKGREEDESRAAVEVERTRQEEAKLEEARREEARQEEGRKDERRRAAQDKEKMEGNKWSLKSVFNNLFSRDTSTNGVTPQLGYSNPNVVTTQLGYSSTNVVTPPFEHARVEAETPELETGRYIITNVRTKSVAKLPRVETVSLIMGGVEGDENSKKWDIELLNNGKYTIKSLATGLYADRGPNPRKKGNVFGSSRPQQWEIIMMQIPGQYVIFPADTQCFWSLSDGGEGTLVEFSNLENSLNSQWRFTKL